MKAIKYLLMTISMIGITGCYTQFVTLEDRYPQQPEQYTDESAETPAKTDTVVIKDQDEHCYWERGFLGDWELRCYKTRFSNSYYSYYNRPWWYAGSSFNDYSCSCPYHVTFHSNCEYCWYYCDRYQRSRPYGYGSYPYGHPYYNNGYGTIDNDNSGSGSGTGKNVHTKTPRPSIRPPSTTSSPPGTAPSAGAAMPAGTSSQGIVDEGANSNTSPATETPQPASADLRPAPRGSNANKTGRTFVPLTAEQKKENVQSGAANPVKRDPQPVRSPESKPGPGMSPDQGRRGNDQPAKNEKDSSWSRKRRSIR